MNSEIERTVYEISVNDLQHVAKEILDRQLTDEELAAVARLLWECRACADKTVRLHRFDLRLRRGCNGRCRREFRDRALSLPRNRRSKEDCELFDTRQ